jgi:rhamnulose-1-phosphate aldolase/alcohol dehydrogenase
VIVASLEGVADLVVRSRALGADETLVVHGGGNTSLKTTGADHVGRRRPILVIKASGADLRTVDADGFVALFLDDLLTVRERAAMDDDEMTAFLAHSRADLGPRRPSIETLLHAFLSDAHVDHVHADAICALTNGPDPERIVRDALGPRVAYVPYRRPGFALAREVAVHADAEAVVLGHHGLVTWGPTSEASLARTRDLVERAERYLAGHLRTRTSRAASDLGPADAERLLLTLRGRLSRGGRRILHVDRSRRGVADRDDAASVLAAGPATADHLLRMRAFPVLVRSANDVDAAVDAAELGAREQWERHRGGAPRGTVMRDARPVVALVPGLGTLSAGADEKAARVVAEVAARSHAVASTVIDAFGTAVPLPERDLFDLEYWPLELAKLTSAVGRDLESRVFIVSGAASGIGRDVSLGLASRGAHVALADLDAAGLADVEAAIRASGGAAMAVRADLTSAADVDRLVHETVLRWGGLDGAVSNAGVAVTGRIETLSLDDWSRSLSVNTTSHFLLTRRVLGALGVQGTGGSLVYVASKNAFSPGDGFGAYSVAKAAEVQLARIVAIEAGRSGVRANVVNPDAVFQGSRLWDGGLREERAAAHRVDPRELEGFYAGRSLLGVAVRGSDVADAVAFCLSDRSSRMTGCVLTVDGGIAAAFPR